jgi:hypothetical protein
LEFWTDPSYVLARTERFTWSATGTLRFGNFPSRPYDRRAGAELEYTITNRVGVEFDYVFRNRNDRGPRRNENRLVAGVNYTLVRRGFEVEGKSLYERHIVELAPNFNRYRQQFDMARGGKGLSPWLHQDFTFRQGRGFVRTRTRFGLLWAGDVSTIRAAYQFESISVGTAWAPRHALYTEVEINNPLWGVD